MPESAGLAFKAYEIEELADVYFFRPLGMLFARAARVLRLTPTFVTIVGSLVGIAGGTLLHDDRLGVIGFALIIFHSVLDSSDGQLARMTGQVSELGRMLDGLGGYLTHMAIYIAILSGALARGAGPSMLVLMFAAGLSNVVHAQLYDYYRGSYMRWAITGRLPSTATSTNVVVRVYEGMQRRLSGRHAEVEAALASRSIGGIVSEEDRRRYRDCFYWRVRGWNLMGDNTRFYAVGVLAWLHHLDWFFAFVLLPMNAALAVLWLWQLRADRRFLAELVIG